MYSENNRTSRWALSDTEATGGTPTGRAMEITTRRIRSFTKDPILMLILTDGEPDHWDVPRVIKLDKELPKQKIFPVGVGILTDAVKDLFREYVVMNDISTLALTLGKLTRGKLDKMLVRTDSN